MEEINMKEIKMISSLPTDTRNVFYVSNRDPLLPNPLIKLPVGSVKPNDWLQHQLILMSNGLTGRLPEVSPWCKFENNAWASPDGEGEHGWEELPYWLKGFIDLGFILCDDRIIQKAKRWIEAVLTSQDSDGYFGPRVNKTQNDLWPNMIMCYALMSFYEATGDERILTFMARYFRWQLNQSRKKLLSGKNPWQRWRGGDELDSIYWLYNHTGESWLLDLAKTIHERTADWTNSIPSWHGVNICQGFREPAQYYQQSHDINHLEATERNYEMVMGIYGEVPGGMFGADENCREGYTDPRQAAETCSMVELMFSNEILLKITGNPIYADRCEEIAFNSFPASMTPDLKGLHYLTSPNMIQLDKNNKAPFLQNSGTMLSYEPYETYRCCQHNVSHGWPYYAKHLWMATADNGLAAVLYAACEVEAKVGNGTTVKITEQTDYPFDETINIQVTSQKPVQFPLTLRIPRWCKNAKVWINNKIVKAEPKPSSYIVINRKWVAGDKIRLQLPMHIDIETYEENKNSVSVKRGPLIYSLRIGERWEKYGGTDEWPNYEVYPTTPWNYGLLVNPENPGASFKIVTKDRKLSDQPFIIDNAPLYLIAKGKRIPEWKMERGLVGLLPESPVSSDEPVEEIALIPMGCARLRISSFPILLEAGTLGKS